jgi:hypothetical protein
MSSNNNVVYRVKDWYQIFEKAQGKKCKHARWVPVPNRHDGAGYAEVAEHPRSCELFAAWILILEVASKMPVRGTLFKDGRALTAKDLAKRTRFPEEIFDLAFEVLVRPEIDWIERMEADGVSRHTEGMEGSESHE